MRVRPLSGANRIDMPRFKVGELVQLNFSSASAGGAQQRVARIDAVSGSTITYSGDEQIVQADATGITVSRLDVADPGNGSSRLGIDGKTIAANQIEFSAWRPSDFFGTPVIAIIDGATVVAAQVTAAVQPLSIELAVGTIAGPIALSQPPNRTGSGISTRFAADGATLQFNDSPLGAAPGNGFIVAVPYVDAPATGTGKLDNGTVRVPKDHENVSLELDRLKSVTDHELTHTLQAIRLGPLLLSYIPIFVFECLADFTRAGGPTMSDYVSGTLAGEILSGDGLKANDDAQVAQNGRAATISIGAAKDSGFQLSDKARQALTAKNIQDGAVMVRRSLTPGVNNTFKMISAIGQLVTLGALTNLVNIAGWIGLINWIVQLIGWLASSKPHGVSAQLQSDQKTLTLDAGSSITGLTVTSSVSVQGNAQGGNAQTFIRSVASIDQQTVVLQQEVPLTAGAVEVTLYSSASPFGGARDYFPATIPDTSKPAVMKLGSAFGQTLTLEVRDRIDIRTPSGVSHSTCVAAVNGDEVTVEDEVLVQQGDPNEFTVAKIGTDDAHWLEDTVLNTVRLGWMNYINDPWAQITRHFEPSALPGRITTSSLRYLFSTHSWSPLLIGYFWFDNAQIFSGGRKGHLSNMEQEASHNSGDTYSPIGSLHAEPTVIGDVGRYWLTENGGSRYGTGGGSPGGTPQDFIKFGKQDAPGVSFLQAPVLFQGAATSPTFSSPTPLPANSVPEDFYQLNASGVFQSIAPRGWIPVSPRLERSVGVQVTFTQPNTYKVTAQSAGSVVDSTDVTNADEAQKEDVSKMTFQLNIAEVAVTVATQAIAEGGTATLIPFQRAALSTTPNTNRVYRATPAEPGLVVDFVGSDLQAHTTLDTDDVEISRFHKFNAASNSFDSGITPMHLPDDLDIAVRRIQVTVTNVLQPTVAVGAKTFNGFQATLDQTAAAISPIQPGGTAFLLVPSQIAPQAFTTTTSPASPSPIDPQFAPPPNIPAAVQTFLADGGAFQVTFQANQPPEETTTVTVTIHVGPDAASSVPVTASVELDPFFTLNAGAFTVAKGDPTGLTLTSSSGAQLASDTSIAGVTVNPDHDKVTVIVDAAYSGPPTITILVHDLADASHSARRTLTVT